MVGKGRGKGKKQAAKCELEVASCWDTVPSTGALALLPRSSVIPRSRKPDGEAKRIQNTSKIKLQKGRVVQLSITSRTKKKKKQLCSMWK